MIKRFLSPVTITAICAQILSILVILEVITPSESEAINTVIVALLEAFNVFAVLNNPTDSKSF